MPTAVASPLLLADLISSVLNRSIPRLRMDAPSCTSDSPGIDLNTDQAEFNTALSRSAPPSNIPSRT